MLAGRTLNDVVTLGVQGLLISLVMLPFGLRLHPVRVLLGFALLAAVGLAIEALSHALAIACRKNQENLYMIQPSLLFPLLFLPGPMLPLPCADPHRRGEVHVDPG